MLEPLGRFLVQEAVNIAVWAARGKRAEKCKPCSPGEQLRSPDGARWAEAPLVSHPADAGDGNGERVLPPGGQR